MQQLQKEIGTTNQISEIVNHDYYRADTWQKTINTVAGPNADNLKSLIPAIYPGKTTDDRLLAYSADLARKIRLSFPTETTARMIDNQELTLKGTTGAGVTRLLKAAAPLGFKLGRTPLNAFLKNPPHGLPVLDTAATQSLKTLYRLYQITPSSDSLQAAVKLGFSSARDIASYPKDVFLSRYSSFFPPGEAEILFGQAANRELGHLQLLCDGQATRYNRARLRVRGFRDRSAKRQECHRAAVPHDVFTIRQPRFLSVRRLPIGVEPRGLFCRRARVPEQIG